MSLLVKLAALLLSLWSHASFADSVHSHILLEQLQLIKLRYPYSLPAQTLAWNLEDLLHTGIPKNHTPHSPMESNWIYKKYTLDFNVGYKENQLNFTSIIPSPIQWPILYGKVEMIDENNKIVLSIDLQERVFQIIETQPLNYFLEQEEVLEYLCEVVAVDIYQELTSFFLEQMYED